MTPELRGAALALSVIILIGLVAALGINIKRGIDAGDREWRADCLARGGTVTEYRGWLLSGACTGAKR